MLNRNVFWGGVDHSVNFQSYCFKFIICPVSLRMFEDIEMNGEQCQSANKRSLNFIFEILTFGRGGLLGRGEGRSVSWRKPQTFVAMILFLILVLI